MGYLVLQGGCEFGGSMASSDMRAIALAGGPASAVRIIPAAAAPDNNHARAGKNGQNWFQSLGAGNVAVVPLTDHASAQNPDIAKQLRAARLTYMLGGFPDHLARSLDGTSAWEAMIAAYEDGAVLAGSSAGAMVLCEHVYDPEKKRLIQGLGLVPKTCLIPHHNRYGGGWVDPLRRLLPRTTLVGIDEETGMISDGAPPPCRWSVYGRGLVTLHLEGHIRAFRHGQVLDL